MCHVIIFNNSSEQNKSFLDLEDMQEYSSVYIETHGIIASLHVQFSTVLPPEDWTYIPSPWKPYPFIY
jgi:hypothetical protein